jgi:predicted signal transduction protein with EAL and GGDEF domain
MDIRRRHTEQGIRKLQIRLANSKQLANRFQVRIICLDALKEVNKLG